MLRLHCMLNRPASRRKEECGHCRGDFEGDMSWKSKDEKRRSECVASNCLSPCQIQPVANDFRGDNVAPCRRHLVQS